VRNNDDDDNNNNNNNGKARNQGTTENSHIGHCTHIAESTDVKYKTFSMGNNITCIMNCNYRIAAKLYILETWFVSGI
jgi:hypothetical protein